MAAAATQGGFAPNLDKYLDTLKDKSVATAERRLISLFKRRQVKGAESCAIATARLLRHVVSRADWADAEELVWRIQAVGQRLAAALPRELVIGNIDRRVRGMIRDEVEQDRDGAGAGAGAGDGDGEQGATPLPSSPPPSRPVPSESPLPSAAAVRLARRPGFAGMGPGMLKRTQSSVFDIFAEPEESWSRPGSPAVPGRAVPSDGSSPGSGISTPLASEPMAGRRALQAEVMEGIDEIIDEIQQSYEQVAAYADVYIHAGDCILIHQPCRTVLGFVRRCRRKITVLLMADPALWKASDQDPYQSFRKAMEANGSSVVTLLNTSASPFMAVVDKVILGASAMRRDGGVMVRAGAWVVAAAAKAHRRPVIVLGAVWKINPDDQVDEDGKVEWGDPSRYVDFADGEMVGHVDVVQPVSEFITADKIDLYLTNLGAHTRHHFHDIISEHYKEEDMMINLFSSRAIEYAD